jgi:glycosyltransferase involved in cell wall biosynthesis
MRQGISVVICTYNGAALLPETIRHIARQRVRPDVEWELIVIDNASTDDTATVTINEWRKHGNLTPFSLLHQPKPGLTYAREMALEESLYDFVLFCDDDNWLCPEYVNLAYDLMSQNASIGVLGGYGELEYEPDTPLWAIGHGSFACGPQAKASGKVKHNIVYGAGFVLRKTAYKMISNAGFRPMLSDRLGKNLSAGGDIELCYAIALAGYNIWYDERLKFKHYIPKNRITWDYCVRFFTEGAQSFEALIPYRIRVNKGIKSTASFNFEVVKIFLLHTRKLFPLLFQKVITPHGSEQAKLVTIKLIALKAKIISFRRYSAMKKNFIKILEFEKRSLCSSKGTGYREHLQNAKLRRAITG